MDKLARCPPLFLTQVLSKYRLFGKKNIFSLSTETNTSTKIPLFLLLILHPASNVSVKLIRELKDPASSNFPRIYNLKSSRNSSVSSNQILNYQEFLVFNFRLKTHCPNIKTITALLCGNFYRNIR